MRLVLFQPDIAGNAGTLFRTAACLGASAEVVEPAGFAWSDRSLARAGMDYATRSGVRRHADWDSFLPTLAGRLVLLTVRAATPVWDAGFRADDALLLGSEGAGVPPHVHARADLSVAIPMRPGFRSLNVAVAGGIALAEAIRQTRNPTEARVT